MDNKIIKLKARRIEHSLKFANYIISKALKVNTKPKSK